VADASPAPAGLPSEGGGFVPRDRVLRLYQAIPVAPVWVGVGIACTYLALFYTLRSVTALLSSQGTLWEFLNAVLIAYLLTANAYAVRFARRDLAALRSRLELSDAGFRQLVERVTQVPRWALVTGSAGGLVLGTLIASFDPGVWGDSPVPPATSPLFLWVLLRNVSISWCAVRLGVTEVSLTLGFSRAAELVSVDLLAERSLAPFARKSQRGLVVWVGFSVLFSLFFLGHSARSNVFSLSLILVVLVTVFLVPLLAVHRRIAAAKAEELEHVNERVRRCVAREGPDTGSGPRLADWVAYRGLVERAPEWPINAPALLRALLVAALGVGSWLGGAVVERLLGALLD
jgi:hypothetical protein